MLGPQRVIDELQLTANNGDQPCNHPRVDMIGDGRYIAFAYGSDGETVVGAGNGNTQTYLRILDSATGVLASGCTGGTNGHCGFRISQNADNNQGAPEIVRVGPTHLSIGYYDNNDNRSYYRRVDFDPATMTLSKPIQSRTVVTPTNIGRPTMVPIGDTAMLYCAAKGDQRPPEDGVECALVDRASGDVIQKHLVAASQPSATPAVYMNNPNLTLLRAPMGAAPARVLLQVTSSNGRGKNTNRKGDSMTLVYPLEVTATDIRPGEPLMGVGAYHQHASICSGPYGVSGEVVGGVFEAAQTGSGTANLHLLRYDAPTGKLSVLAIEDASGGNNADSGYIANLYGENPHNQGRDFLRCVGDVPNPGFGVAGGFLPGAETLFALPTSGMKEGDTKNGLYLTLLAGKVAAPLPPTPPTPPPPPPPPVVDPGQGEGGTGNENWTTPPGGEGGIGDAPGLFGCSAGRGSPAGSALAIALLGLACFALVTLARGRR